MSENIKSYLDIEKAAKYLGISKSKLYKMTASCEIPHYKIARRVLFRAEDIDRWVSAHFVDVLP